MSAATDAWLSQYRAQTEFLGSEITATVGAVTDKAIPSAVDLDQVLNAGGLSEGGGFTIQMLASAFSGEPSKFTAVSLLGYSLQVDSVKNNNGIFYISASDPTANEQ